MRKLAVFLFSILTFQSFAWGEKGHKIIAALARGAMNEVVLAKIDKYLAGTTWENAACWMDGVFNDKKYEYMRPWHFTTLSKDKSYVKVSEPNLLNQLEACINVLKKREMLPDQMVKESIEMLLHLVADLHQPLHDGYPEDKNGTLFLVKYNGQSTDLHAFWDDTILDAGKVDIWACTSYIFSLERKERLAIQQMDFVNWYEETRLCLGDVYDTGGNNLNNEYVNRMKPMAVHQLSKAGLRLAAILKEIFV